MDNVPANCKKMQYICDSNPCESKYCDRCVERLATTTCDHGRYCDYWQMLSNRIPPTICCYGNSYSISTLCAYCRIDGALIMCLETTPTVPTVVMDPKRPEANRSELCHGLASISAASFANKQSSVVISVLYKVLICTHTRACRAGGFTLVALEIGSMRARRGFFFLRTTVGDLTFYLRATTFLALASFFQ